MLGNIQYWWTTYPSVLLSQCLSNPTHYRLWWRYGDDAGKATDTAVQSVINVGVTTINMDNLGIKAILKTTGKKTAKAVIKDHRGQPEREGEEKRKEEEEEEEEKKK